MPTVEIVCGALLIFSVCVSDRSLCVGLVSRVVLPAPNETTPVNAPMASRFQVVRLHRRVPELRR